jgi:hypothetical protein
MRCSILACDTSLFVNGIDKEIHKSVFTFVRSSTCIKKRDLKRSISYNFLVFSLQSAYLNVHVCMLCSAAVNLAFIPLKSNRYDVDLFSVTK